MSEAEPQLETVAAIEGHFEQRRWNFAEDRRADIDAHWEVLSGGNPLFFNGRVLLQHSHSFSRREDGSRVYHGAWLETDYKSFIACRDFGWPDPDIRNCFAMGALRGADGAFLLGEMGAHTSNAGRIYFAAGTPDPSDISDGRVDLAGSIARELFEETEIDASDLSAEPGWTVVLDGPRVACMKELWARETSGVLAARITDNLKRQAEPELARIHIIRSAAEIDEARTPLYMATYLRAAFARGR